MNAVEVLSGIAIRHSARLTQAALGSVDLLSWSRTVTLAIEPAAAMDCLRRLGCLVDWWPGARALRPLAPGLCGVGDVGLLDTASGERLLRVLAFRPGRLVLVLAARRSLTVLDVGVRASAAGSALTLSLERPPAGGALANHLAGRRLARLGERALAGLQAHLRERVEANDAA